MKTHFKSAPGFFAAQTHEADAAIPKGGLRVFTASFEVYDFDESEMDTKFPILAAKSEDSEQMRKLLEQLHNHLQSNIQHIAHGGKSKVTISRELYDVMLEAVTHGCAAADSRPETETRRVSILEMAKSSLKARMILAKNKGGSNG